MKIYNTNDKDFYIIYITLYNVHMFVYGYVCMCYLSPLVK